MGLTAITLAYPVSALIGAGAGLGLAGAIRFTILSAQGEEEQTRECFSGTTLLILLAGVLLTALLFLAYVRITTAYFYAAEKTALSYLLVYAEPVCTLLLLLALPPVFGLNGVWLAAALGADGHICYRAHCETESGQSGIAQKSKNRRRRTALFREAWTALELRTAVSGGKRGRKRIKSMGGS